MATSIFAGMVERELEKARAKHAPINSHHEGYAVILEELDEFWAEVKAYRGSKWDEDQRADWNERVLHELVQVAAMAQRCAEDCS